MTTMVTIPIVTYYSLNLPTIYLLYCVSLHNIPSFNPISRGLNILVFGSAMKGVKTIPNIHSINFQQMKNCRCGNRKMFRNELYLFIIAS